MNQPGSKMGVPAKLADGSAADSAGRTRRSWGCAAVAIVLIIVSGLLCWYFVAQTFKTVGAMPDGLHKLADAVRPKIVIQEVVLSTVADVHRQNKLVVLDVPVTVDITRQEGSKSWGVYWGTNTARVLVKDAHAQYVIDLSSVGTADFSYDENSKTLTITVPHPQVDPKMVSIDPAKIQTLDLSGGWARFDKRDTWDHAIAELTPKVIMEAGRPLVRKEAEEAGKEAMLNLMRPMAETMSKDGIQLEIRYRD